jgi:hypothetical protein
MTQGTIETTEQLARVRGDLLVAIEGDRRRSRRRSRRRVAGLLVAATLASATAAGAATGFFAAAPRWVKEIFGAHEGVDATEAIQVGVIDDHITYAAPSDDGGFCIFYGPYPRSGPNGLGCIPTGAGGLQDDQIVMTVAIGHDGGFVIGRVATADATAVDLLVPGVDDPIQTPVREHGFFLLQLPDASMRVVMPGGVGDLDRLASLTATATDATGATIARSATPYVQPNPEGDASSAPSP